MKKLTIWVSNSNGVNFNQRKNQSAARIYAVSNSNGVNFNFDFFFIFYFTHIVSNSNGVNFNTTVLERDHDSILFQTPTE